MIVENHEITEERGKESIATISGRSLETVLENRMNFKRYPGATFPEPRWEGLDLASNNRATHIIQLINNSMDQSEFFPDTGMLLPGFVFNILNGTDVGPTEAISVEPGVCYQRVKELMSSVGLGMLVQRPDATALSDPRIAIRVHNGVDRSSEVIFSWLMEDFESSKYLKSIKTLQHGGAASVVDFLVRGGTGGPATNYYERRYGIWLSFDDLTPNKFPQVGMDTPWMQMQAAAIERWRTYAGAFNVTNLMSFDVGNNTRLKYREHYNIGDHVMLHGRYDVNQKVRVVEYAETFDQFGVSGQPTFEPMEE